MPPMTFSEWSKWAPRRFVADAASRIERGLVCRASGILKSSSLIRSGPPKSAAPHFASKLVAIPGLYLSQPELVIVLCADEMGQI